MSSLNKVMLIGRLGKDPDVRTTSNGAVVNLSVATSERWKDKVTGEIKEKTEWHHVVSFNERIVDMADKFLVKGCHVYIEGALQTRSWLDKDQKTRYATEVVIGNYRGDLVMLEKPKRPPGYVEDDDGAGEAGGADTEIPF